MRLEHPLLLQAGDAGKIAGDDDVGDLLVLGEDAVGDLVELALDDLDRDAGLVGEGLGDGLVEAAGIDLDRVVRREGRGGQGQEHGRAGGESEGFQHERQTSDQ